MAQDCCSFHLISGDGVLNREGLENFSRTTNLSQRGVSYAVVAIMGPQSGGKSTLLNKLFQTDFRMMDADDGRTQTTQGIWIAKAIGIKPFTICIDVEGSDSRERGQDGATFEKQSALFALAIADIVMINMWCHDIGREHAANRPLLKAVFEAMLRLFGARKTTLLFVLRDQTKTPFERLEHSLRGDIEKIWAEIPKPDAYKGTPLGDFFKVEITALPSYEIEEDKFKVKVDRLRQRFLHSISPGGLAGDRKDVQPASGFALRAEQIWKTIKENKDLDLPAMEVMVATFRCVQIATETLSRLNSDKAWLALRKGVQARLAPKFRKRIRSILENTLSQYDKEAIHFKESIRDDKRKELEKEALQVLYPAYVAMLRHLRSRALKFFMTRMIKKVKRATEDGFEASIESTVQHAMGKFEKESGDVSISKEWDASATRENLLSEIEKTKYETKTKFYEVYNTMKARAVRGLALGIGGITGAGVATAAIIGDWDPVAAMKAGEETATLVRKIIKRRMLNLDNFNYNTSTDSNASPDCENASDTADDPEE
ncbi:PROTEIN SEY1 [Salix purpurea]|uniref:PROTEIN SEY1 n=1 Tax=Salix purpurea TaxID=77065 RepID=A0A9Q0VGG2_SALPP|nr:PROTEIN SEY1 [Salix purpurea]